MSAKIAKSYKKYTKTTVIEDLIIKLRIILNLLLTFIKLRIIMRIVLKIGGFTL